MSVDYQKPKAKQSLDIVFEDSQESKISISKLYSVLTNLF